MFFTPGETPKRPYISSLFEKKTLTDAATRVPLGSDIHHSCSLYFPNFRQDKFRGSSHSLPTSLALICFNDYMNMSHRRQIRFHYTQMLHGAGLCANSLPKNDPNVGKIGRYSSTMEQIGQISSTPNMFVAPKKYLKPCRLGPNLPIPSRSMPQHQSSEVNGCCNWSLRWELLKHDV